MGEQKSSEMKATSKALSGESQASMRVEILDMVDTSTFSQELKDHYRSHVLPLLRRIHPDGPSIHFAFLLDPPAIEIRKMVG